MPPGLGRAAEIARTSAVVRRELPVAARARKRRRLVRTARVTLGAMLTTDGAARTEQPHVRMRHWPWLGPLLAIVLACVAPTLGFGLLAWDDRQHVSENAAVVDPSNAPARDLLLTPGLGYPIPLTVATYRAEHALFGLKPWVFHASNALLHVLVAAMSFVLARRMGLSPASATLAVVVFALHPVVAEPVSWISGRKDLLATAFALLALRCALGATRRARLLAPACYLLGMLSKPSIAALCLPLVFAPLCFRPAGDRRERWREFTRVLPRLLPYVSVLLPIAAAGVLGQAKHGALADTAVGLSRVRALWYALGHHLSLVLFWEPPTAKYLPTPWPPAFDPRVDLSPLLVAMVIAAALHLLRGAARRVALFGVIWAAASYLPSSGALVPLTRFLADSYLYCALIGLGWLLGAILDGVAEATAGRWRRLSAALPWLTAAALMPAFLVSSERFVDDEQLWAHTMRRFPDHPRVCRQWANGVAYARGAVHGLAATDSCIARFGPGLFIDNRALLLSRIGSEPVSSSGVSPGQAGSAQQDSTEHGSAGRARVRDDRTGR
jgi:protein O-mannosyl-transferase